MKKIYIIALLAMVLLLPGCATILEKYNEPVNPENTDEILVAVPKGASTTSIANLLLEHELIQNVNAFKAKAKTLELDGKMKAGDYMLSQSMSSEAIIRKIASGEVYEDNVKFTIPEGFETRQIIDKLVEEGIADREALIQVLENEPFEYPFLENVDRSYRLEGYLFPDTYIVKRGSSEKEIVSKMLNRFNEIFKPEYYDRAKALDMSVDEVVTLASIIERETKLAEERPVVSSVFHNRIDQKMMLQSCATIQYVLKERKDRLTYDDLEIVSPFNTYQHAGLTPAPIASPGEQSIIAALYPADTNYLYFVTTEKNDGSHYFNETLAGHNRDKEKGKGN
ncbi:endolytic transglycosylase MltG [Fusibacter ferrireducens]|uniref:Endolytic murein transglycosylase n=1 Tax=Fusibacter ferrireducens TaxID=2785058 RepID=A0ABR9ZTM1_9FIRM|nr:endolytic transglycosylase MltG [Fusibacter ferrireducens]MBF4693696.1 endolytic transglycosylase MltG [Fusibacter ferrireducens]